MDEPSRDMRDPKYRRQLAREQALGTSAPELMLVGPGGGASSFTRFVRPAPKPSGAIPEIGSRTPRALHKQNLKELKSFDDMSFAEKKALARSTTKAQLREAKDRLDRSISTPEEKFERAVGDVIGGAVRTTAYDRIVNKKKGGTVKSASSRADGIAQRGKTRGKMR
jgi:hypothetical protein